MVEEVNTVAAPAKAVVSRTKQRVATAVTKKASLGVATDLAHVSARYTKDDGVEHAYFGRGYAQLTWWSNYARVGAQTGQKLELLFDPDKALDSQTSYDVLSYSLRTGKGFANGHKLGDYFYGGKTDYAGARAMVNGKDHAADIAKYAKSFETILLDPKVRAGVK